jgi:uncharacterized protein (TIGR03790 family)
MLQGLMRAGDASLNDKRKDLFQVNDNQKGRRFSKSSLQRIANAVFPAVLLFVIAGIGSVLLSVQACWSLEPTEILMVTNKNAPDSLPLARYYMGKRGIPDENWLEISVTDHEQCSRDEYEKKIALPIRKYLTERNYLGPPLRCIVTVYGVPLTITKTDLSLNEKAVLTDMQGKSHLLNLQLQSLKDNEKGKRKAIQNELDPINNKINFFKKANKGAAVDSELALVLQKGYPLLGWLPNPLYRDYDGTPFQKLADGILMTCRLDGPSAQIVRRMIDDSLTAERKGLIGKAYFDARWPYPGDKPLTDYARYDRSIQRAADLVKKSGVMPAILDEKPTLFQPGECPDAALYCGWYSLGKYVDAFTWRKGAVAYHIASSECTTLKQKGSQVWCKRMLEEGAAAVVGPVDEPYVQAFPVPEVFFGLLMEGSLTLAECYAAGTPYMSWRMVLIGDPLYRPFINAGRKAN